MYLSYHRITQEVSIISMCKFTRYHETIHSFYLSRAISISVSVGLPQYCFRTHLQSYTLSSPQKWSRVASPAHHPCQESWSPVHIAVPGHTGDWPPAPHGQLLSTRDRLHVLHRGQQPGCRLQEQELLTDCNKYLSKEALWFLHRADRKYKESWGAITV